MTQPVKWITCCNCGRQYAVDQCPWCQYRPVNLADIFRHPPMPIIPRMPAVPEIEALPVDVPIRRIASYFDVDVDVDPIPCCVPEFPCRECMIKGVYEDAE